MASAEIYQDLFGSRFVMPLADDEAELTYRISGSEISLDYVGVPHEWRKRGLAGELTRAALEYARRENLEVNPRCPYVIWYLAQHPEYHDLVRD